MKKIIFLIVLCFLSGCSSADWINAAGSIMQAKDKNDKEIMKERIKSANKAAGY